ncbi:type II toxin-antitoxin system VapC family toxin [Candidatus Sumerlaeota bacterium]|nr:type II toxin-antitoxin system VapC family toxin [Candidatus Sumerlaeota bacterium]
MKSIYVETSIISYLTSRPSRDLRSAAWQQITNQWWRLERKKYDLFTSELVVAEASYGDPEAAKARLEALRGIDEIPVNDEAKAFAARLIENGGVPSGSEADALHIALACVHEMDYLLTWNFRHIDNAETKPIIRSICVTAGYTCPEICTPLELFSEEQEYV